MSSKQEIKINILLDKLRLNEKFILSSGKNLEKTNAIRRLGIKSLKMTNGPHGIGAPISLAIFSGILQNTGVRGIFLFPYLVNSRIFKRKRTTYFPTGICQASTWNPKLAYQMGKSLAEESKALGYHMVFAPAVNIDRTPLNGRTFEYLSEDPFLNQKIAVPIVKGIQSQKVAACVKHFVANNQETRRGTVSSEISERALNEIYYPAFEAVVKKADCWSVMASYNRVNSIHLTENRYLLVDKLMDEWGFRGFVVSDYLATLYNYGSGSCIDAGLSLEMPGFGRYFGIKYGLLQLQNDFNKGRFTKEVLNRNVLRLLRVMSYVGLFENPQKLPKGCINTEGHIRIAKKIAEEGIVLLKNERNLLPINIAGINTISVIGPNANREMALGGGSSMVLPFYEVTPLEGLKKKCKPERIKFISNPADADITIFVGGLNHEKNNDNEMTDRKKLALPESQVKKIQETASKNPRIIVVLINGSPISMDEWIDKVPSIIEAWYPGMEGGNTLADIIFGDINPSGKLPITFPKKLSDSPAHSSSSDRTYPGSDKVYYDEDILVGYRWFDYHNIDPLFPFGYGLSYTEFNFQNLKIEEKNNSKEKKINVAVDVTNTGNLTGKETVQLYIKDVESTVTRPPQELKGFEKIKLNPKEKTKIQFSLNKKHFSFWDEKNHKWIVENGVFEILIGNSSRNTPQRKEINLEFI